MLVQRRETHHWISSRHFNINKMNDIFLLSGTPFCESVIVPDNSIKASSSSSPSTLIFADG
jgi:hypothetical protein